MKRIAGKDVETLHYDGLPGRPIAAVRWPPPGADTPDWQNTEQNRIAQGVIQRFAKFDDAYARVAPNANLSTAGKLQATAAEREAAHRTVAEANRWVNERGQINAAKRSKLHAVPQLEPSDAVGALRDREIREGLGPLTDLQRQKLRAEMKAGRAEGALHALLRDPLGDLRLSPDAEHARNIWRDRVKAKSGPELAALDGDDALNEWLAAVAEGHQRNVLDRIDRCSMSTA